MKKVLLALVQQLIVSPLGLERCLERWLRCRIPVCNQDPSEQAAEALLQLLRQCPFSTSMSFQAA